MRAHSQRWRNSSLRISPGCVATPSLAQPVVGRLMIAIVVFPLGFTRLWVILHNFYFVCSICLPKKQIRH